MIGLVPALVLAVVVMVALLGSIKVVPAAHVAIVERLGKYSRTLQPGLHLLVPIVDAVKTRVDMREQKLPYHGVEVVTSDNYVVLVDSQAWAMIVDPVRATYEVASVFDAIEQLVRTTQRIVIGELAVGEVDASRATIGQRMRVELEEATAAWGVRINRFEVQSIQRSTGSVTPTPVADPPPTPASDSVRGPFLD